MTIKIKNLAIAGYRSFGKDPQYFDNFTKVNLFIGRNNAGKSNIIRFLSEIVAKMADGKMQTLDELAYHRPSRPPLLIGACDDNIVSEDDALVLPDSYRLLSEIEISNYREREYAKNAITAIFNEKRRIDGGNLCWSFIVLPNKQPVLNSWLEAIKVLDDNQVNTLWHLLTHRSGGGRKEHWEPEVIQKLQVPIPNANVVVIPAIRQIGAKGSNSDGFEGLGIIERLARLQNPDVHNQADRNRFYDITMFLRTVIGNQDATIEIPFERDTILVYMDGKVLPIESLGTGIHEVLILASAATVLTDTVICIEEPELHLNPILQRKLIRYLTEHTTNQYFISTHSAALMDNNEVEIYHVRLQDSVSVVERVTSDHQRSTVCEDLGYHPSDLLQANCVIWVEGPSDRVYINYWLRGLTADLIEGIHYSIMFYGGKLASHLSNEDYPDEIEINDFISLRRLNRRGVIILDSDQAKPHVQLNQTKKRLQMEFDNGPGHAWVTDGREIENYIPPDQLRTAITTKCLKSKLLTNLDRYDNCLKIMSQTGKETQAPKVEVARYITSNYEPDFNILDLKQRMKKLIEFIRESNPTQ
ncbi:MAG: ATP-binding protein [Chlorobium sp.]|nr:MAG: ATP-binding protein [Chlorobium sp.]